MKDVFLIRHAESLANIGEATTSPAEIPLSEAGLKQASDLAAASAVRPDLMVYSPYRRAKQTAQPFLEKYADVTAEELPVQEFTYLSVSRCRGTNREQRKPWVNEYWQRADPNYSDGDQAESFGEFMARCARFKLAMAEIEFEVAFVFTHEQFIKGLVWTNLIQIADSASMSGFYSFDHAFRIPNVAAMHSMIDADGHSYFGNLDASHQINA
ncbi:MAG: phosphoglycerate mutase family protein [Acidobacteriota bacterium]